ncbi:hypothetical protein FOCC_FOCC012457, partial [Frankliniella occidentalis]
MDRADGFNYGCLEAGNKPPVRTLTRAKLMSESCPFSAAEMLCFTHYLGELFNEPLEPKQHHMLHYRSIMLRAGPLVNLWCMRFESKQRELKDYVLITNSRIKLPLTVLIKNQLKFCHRLI